MLYTYWDDDQSQIDSAKAWNEVGMPLKVFRQSELLSLIKREHPDYYDLVEAIALPAARSDVARIVLGHKYGGLYIDAHVGPPADISSVKILLGNAYIHDIVLFEKAHMRKGPGDIHLVNTAIACRQGSDLVFKILTKIMKNLLSHYKLELASDFTPYNIAVLTGAWNLRELFLVEKLPGSLVLSPEIQERIYIQSIGIDPDRDPVRFYAFYGYRKPGKHWSERQLSEPFFKKA